MSFEELGISSWLQKTLIDCKISEPTPVQCACIEPALEGRDVLACAKTGSGKTAAFALPILEKLALDPYGVFAVVLTPTRELASQIADQFKLFGTNMKVRVELVTGGIDQTTQRSVKNPATLGHTVGASLFAQLPLINCADKDTTTV